MSLRLISNDEEIQRREEELNSRPLAKTASELCDILELKHLAKEDVFIPECKTGGTWANQSLHILDAWAMRKSWAHPRTTGYEIKVTRSDFMRDEKFIKYLPYCNMLYFVSIPGIIRPEELPAEVGLIERAKTSNALLTKKKAPYRKVEIPEEFYRYILFSRAQIGVDKDGSRESKIKFWTRWLNQKYYDWYIGHIVSSTIKQRIDEDIFKIRNKNKNLQEDNRRLNEIVMFFMGELKLANNGEAGKYDLTDLKFQLKLKKRELRAGSELWSRTSDILTRAHHEIYKHFREAGEEVPEQVKIDFGSRGF